MASRRSPGAASWLDVVESATAAWTGAARLVGEEPVPETGTSFRGPGFALSVEVTPDGAVVGEPPAGPVTLRLLTARPAERREPPGAYRFPPDTLREVPYADQAVPGTGAPVLVVASDPPVVRGLLAPDDDLPDAVRVIHRWTRGDAEVLGDLAAGVPPLAVVAGYELLLRSTTDVAALTDRVLRLPGLPGAATRGVLALLHLRTGSLPDEQVVAVARTLLDVLADETDPEGVVAALTWLDAHRDRYRADPDLRALVDDRVRRVTSLTFDGPDADSWQQEVARHADPLREG